MFIYLGFTRLNDEMLQFKGSSTNAGQDAPPTMGVESKHIL